MAKGERSDWLISEEMRANFKDGAVLDRHCKAEVANAVALILDSVGEDVNRDGLLKTPDRVARMYDEILAGYKVDPVKLLNNALFDVDYQEMVIVSDIDFHSMCEHHLLPIVGKAHVAYVPDAKVVGLSKIPRVVEAYARRLQVQERMTRQIANLIEELVEPQGIGVVVDGHHMCVSMRGAKKANARMRTTYLTGSFEDNPKTRSEFLDAIPHPVYT